MKNRMPALILSIWLSFSFAFLSNSANAGTKFKLLPWIKDKGRIFDFSFGGSTHHGEANTSLDDEPPPPYSIEASDSFEASESTEAWAKKYKRLKVGDSVYAPISQCSRCLGCDGGWRRNDEIQPVKICGISRDGRSLMVVHECEPGRNYVADKNYHTVSSEDILLPFGSLDGIKIGSFVTTDDSVSGYGRVLAINYVRKYFAVSPGWRGGQIARSVDIILTKGELDGIRVGDKVIPDRLNGAPDGTGYGIVVGIAPKERRLIVHEYIHSTRTGRFEPSAYYKFYSRELFRP